MQTYSPEKVINGTFGELWIDDFYMAEVTGLEAKVSLDTTDVNRTGTLAKGTKVTGISGSGTVTLNKVTSYFIEKLSANMLAGKTTACTIKSLLADPDSDGQEQVTLKNCVFNELTLANWKAGELGEESVPFTFDDWKIDTTVASN